MTSPAQEVVSLFLRREADPDAEGPPRTVTLRLTAERVAWIDALAKAADRSRNAMANELLRVGISDVLAQLPDVVREEVEEHLLESLQGNE